MRSWGGAKCLQNDSKKCVGFSHAHLPEASDRLAKLALCVLVHIVHIVSAANFVVALFASLCPGLSDSNHVLLILLVSHTLKEKVKMSQLFEMMGWSGKRRHHAPLPIVIQT